MRSSKEINERIYWLRKLIDTDKGDSIELISIELEALKWASEGPKRYSFKTIRDLIVKHIANNDRYINGFDLIEYMEKVLDEPKEEVKIE